jgi:hypothetical protein
MDFKTGMPSYWAEYFLPLGSGLLLTICHAGKNNILIYPEQKNMKTLLRPTLLKIVLAFVLFALFSYIWRIYVISTLSDTFPWGFPLQFYLAWGPCQPGEVCSEIKIFYLIIDALCWYIVSLFLVSRFAKVR